MNVKRETAFSVLALLTSALFVVVIMRAPGDSLAQKKSDDLLSIFFKDARSVLAKSLVTRADSYYHGGVTMGNGVYCDHDHDHDAHDEEDNPTHGEEHSDAHGEEHKQTHSGEHKHTHEEDVEHHEKHLIDPWGWINARIHVQEHRHLQGEELEEIIPWIWAACRASPYSTEAYGMGWYVLAKMRKQVDAGLAILEEGIRNNPDDLDLAFTLGQSLYTDKKDHAAAESVFHLVRETAIRKSNENLTRLSDDDGRILASALMYLTRIAEERGDIEAMRGYFEVAHAVAPNFAATRGIKRMIGEWESDSWRPALQ